MFYFGLLSTLIPTVILAAAISASVRAIWLTVVPQRRGVREPSCEKCRYPVEGLTVLICPECGSNLLKTGIITRPMEVRRRGGLVGAICGLLFLMLMAVLIALSIIVAVFDPYTIGSARGSGYQGDALFVFYSLYYSTPAIGALLAVLLVFLLVRRRRRLVREADALDQPTEPVAA